MEIDLEDAKALVRHYRQRIASLEETVARLNGAETENTQLKQRTVELEELVARSNGANTEEEYRQRITELEELVARLNGVRAQLQDKTAEADGLTQRNAELEQQVMQLRAQQAQTQATNASDRNDEMEIDEDPEYTPSSYSSSSSSSSPAPPAPRAQRRQEPQQPSTVRIHTFYYTIPAPRGNERILREFSIKDWDLFLTGNRELPGFKRVMLCFERGTLLPNDFITAHDHPDMAGSDWLDESQPPRESWGVPRPGAWLCGNNHTPDTFWMSSSKKCCKCCGDYKPARNEAGDVVTATWDLPKGKYVMFARNTGFVNRLDFKINADGTVTVSSGNRHLKTNFARVRAFLFALFPGITEEVARLYYARCVDFTEGEEERKRKTEACVEITIAREQEQEEELS